jgi:hypothetical protein
VTIPQKPELSGATIVESYRDFEPPTSFRQTVETLLKYVPAKYLVGLKTIVLINRAGLTSNQRKRKVWSRNRKIRLAEALGAYSKATKSSEATVWLYVDNICEMESSWWRKVPFLRYMITSDALYHEIGHHIHTVHKPIYDEREDVAEDWGRKLWGHFVRKRYWYLFPMLNVFARAVSPPIKWAKWTKFPDVNSR